MQKTYLITGAGSGIGSATAIKLAGEDHKLILIGRRKGLLDDLCDDCDISSAYRGTKPI